MHKTSVILVSKILIGVLLSATPVLSSCATPARYIFVSDNQADVRYDNVGQRYICLDDNDAITFKEMLLLRTKSDVQKYGQKRPLNPQPVEDVLYHLITENYTEANKLLGEHQDAIPKYLRLMLKADLTTELAAGSMQAKQVINLYQEAQDVQPCKISKNLINFRIRQWRYRR